jgi:hypothetical protein
MFALKVESFCFILTVKEWMINKESDSQEIPNPAISSNTNPTCNEATITLKMVVMGGWRGAEATISYAQTSAKKVSTSSD